MLGNLNGREREEMVVKEMGLVGRGSLLCRIKREADATVRIE